MKFLWITIYVKNLDESIAFYSNLLGLQVMKRFPAGPGIEIAFMGNGIANETSVELLADSNSCTANYSEFVSIGFAVDSVDTMLNTVRSKNIPVQSEPVETPGSKIFTIKDPNGFNIQLFQQKKRFLKPDIGSTQKVPFSEMEGTSIYIKSLNAISFELNCANVYL